LGLNPALIDLLYRCKPQVVYIIACSAMHKSLFALAVIVAIVIAPMAALPMHVKSHWRGQQKNTNTVVQVGLLTPRVNNAFAFITSKK